MTPAEHRKLLCEMFAPLWNQYIRSREAFAVHEMHAEVANCLMERAPVTDTVRELLANVADRRTQP